MNVIVIGGTGFIGRHVVKRLLDADCRVLVFHRGKTDQDTKGPAESITGDRKKLADQRSEFQKFGPDLVIDLIAFTEDDANSLVETFKGIAERLILISSMDVYRNYGLFLKLESSESNRIPITEKSKLRSIFYPYRSMAKDKAALLFNYDKIPVEQIVLDAKYLSGTVLRLPKIFGIGDHKHYLHEYVKRMKDGREYILLDKKHAEWIWTRGYVENVADAITLCTVDKRATDQIFNVGDIASFSESEWVTKIGRQYGWDGRVLTVAQNELPKHLQTEYDYDYHLEVNSDKIRRELGFKNRISIDNALEKTIEWELEHQSKDFDVNHFDYTAEDKVIEKHK
ncbi:MAG: NAD-dependent epimerase/dehydratase family protein [Pyrinomonadaceae bacterium]|nr:NAD-dependent epimerase/dehydratase family protein [Pyrinomonadaceae bacterium]